MLQDQVLPCLGETGTMFPLIQEGVNQHLHSMRPGSTLYQPSGVHENVGRRLA
jgi:hypothetical protein